VFRVRLYFGIYIFFFILFGVMCYLAHEFATFHGDITVSNWMQGIDFAFFTLLMKAVSFLGRAVPVSITVALLAASLLLLRRIREAFFVVILPAIAGLANELTKALVDRPRPSDTVGMGINSFPSGHTTYAMVICGCIFFLAPRVLKWPVATRIIQVLSVLFVALMGFSRIFLQAHWPSDVLGGLILGGLILAPGIFIYRYYVESDRVESEVENARAP
jgi:undecaprenyl-diphosphatase